jgi:hypothetical protein
VHWPKVTIWRVSAAELGSPANRHPNGEILGFDVSFSS